MRIRKRIMGWVGLAAMVVLVLGFALPSSPVRAGKDSHRDGPLSLELKVVKDGNPGVGETVTLEYTVENEADDRGLTVSVTLPPFGTVMEGVYLEPGGSATGTRGYTVTEEDLYHLNDKGELEFTATAAARDGEGSVAEVQDTASVKITGTTLKDVEVTADSSLKAVSAYGWSVEKTVDPAALTLERGESGTLTYTITAARTGPEVEVTAEVAGEVTINNGGDKETCGLAVEIQVQYNDGGGYRDLEGASTVLEPGEIAAGGSRTVDYSVGFAPVEGATGYRVVAHVTILNHSGSLGEASGPDPKADFGLPAEPDDSQIRYAEAQIADLISCPAGFTCAPSTLGPWTPSGDQFEETVTVTVTNESASAGTYTFGNEATLTSGDLELSDEVALEITVPQEVGETGTSLAAGVTADPAAGKITYAWTLDKTVAPGSLTLAAGQSGTLTFEITADRSVSSESLPLVTGVVTVQNTGEVATQGLEVTVRLQYEDGSGVYHDLEGAGASYDPAELAAGGSCEVPYELSFAPVAGAAGYRVAAQATILNHSGHLGGVFGPEPAILDFELPETDVHYGAVSISDLMSCPAGFTCDPSTLGPWAAQDDFRQTVTVTVTNAGAAAGTYTLGNTATLTSGDLQLTDPAEAGITVPQPGQPPSGGDDGEDEGQPPAGGDGDEDQDEEQGDEEEEQPPAGGDEDEEDGTAGGEEQPLPEEVTVPEEPEVAAPGEGTPAPEPVQVPAEQKPAAPTLPFTGGQPLLYYAVGAALAALGVTLRRRR